MKTLNNKPQIFKSKMRCYSSIALIALICASASQAMDCVDKDLLENTFRIKSVKIEKYMFISDKIKEGGGKKAILGGNKEEADVFRFERAPEGWRIRKDGTDQYLFSSEYKYCGGWCGGNRYLGADKNPITTDQYFDIFSRNNKYVIMNLAYREYLFLTDVKTLYDGISARRPFALSHNQNNDKTFFELEKVATPSTLLVTSPVSIDNSPETIGLSHGNNSKPAVKVENKKVENPPAPMEKGNPPPPPTAKPSAVKARPVPTGEQPTAKSTIMQQPFNLGEEIEKAKGKPKKVGPVVQKPVPSPLPASSLYSLLEDPKTKKMIANRREAISPKDTTDEWED